jgi:hypothetical protein
MKKINRAFLGCIRLNFLKKLRLCYLPQKVTCNYMLLFRQIISSPTYPHNKEVKKLHLFDKYFAFLSLNYLCFISNLLTFTKEAILSV